MAEYQIGSQTYELPDNLPPQQLNQILSQLASQQANNEPDTSFSSAFQSGIDAPLENMATTARMLGAEGTADTLSGLTDAPTNYESASDRFINPEEGDFTIGGFAPGYLPRAAVEQAGQFAGSLATRAGGATVGGLVAGPGGAVAGGLAGPALFEFVQQLGPVAQERARNNGREEPTWEDWTAAAGTAGLSGALNSIGVKGFSGAGLLNRTLKEGVTETAQSVVEQTGSTAGTDAGLQVNPKQAIGEGIIGGTSAGTVSAATDTVSGAANLTGRGLRAAKDAVIPSDTPSDAEAAADFAADLQRVSDEDGYNLKDVDTGSATGARAAVDTLHMEYGSQIEVMVSDLVDRLKETADDTQLQALEKAKANAAKRKAKNKVKSRVDPTDFQVIQKLTAGTDEGAKLIALMRKSNELSALANKSVKGGISQFTDVFNPLDSDGRYNIGRAIAAPVSGLGAIASGGTSLAPAIAGRAIDAVTGRRSRVANYVKQNQGNQGIQIPNLPSERTRKQQEQAAKDQAALAEEERKKALALEATQLNDPPKGFPGDQTPSPQYAMETGTGLTRRGVADALKVLRRTRPKLSKAIDTYQTMLETGQQSADLTPLIRAVKGLRKKYPQLFENTQGETDNSVAIPTSTATESPNIKRGIEDNRKFIQEQKRKIADDVSLSGFDRKVASQAIEDLEKNLGSDPLTKAEQIMRKALASARDKNKIREHVLPYVLRVTDQQKAKRRKTGEVSGEIDFPQPVIRNDDGMLRENTDYEMEIMQAANQLNNALQAQQSEKDKWKLTQSVMKEGVKRLDPEGRETISQIQIGLKGGKGVSAEELARLTPMLTNAFRYLTRETAPSWVDKYRGVYTPDRTIMVRPLAPSIVKTFSIEDVDFDPQKGILDNRPLSPHTFMRTFAHELGHAIEDQSGLRDVLKAMKKVTDWNYELSEGAMRETKVPSFDYRKPDEIVDAVGTSFTSQLPKDFKENMELLTEAVTLSTQFRTGHWADLSNELRQLEQAMSSKLLTRLPTDEFGFPTDFREGDQELPIYGPAILSALNLDFLEIMENEGSLGLSPSKEKRLRTAMNKVRDRTLYLYNAAELGADAVAHYMVYPEETRRMAPKLAKLIRKTVNESSVRDYLTFHSLAGLLGAAGLSAAIQAALSGEDDEERPGILNLLQPQGILQQASI